MVGVTSLALPAASSCLVWSYSPARIKVGIAVDPVDVARIGGLDLPHLADLFDEQRNCGQGAEAGTTLHKHEWFRCRVGIECWQHDVRQREGVAVRFVVIDRHGERRMDAEWEIAAKARTDFADMVEGLTPDQLSHPSLCDDWSVQDVAQALGLAYGAEYFVHL